MSGLTNMLMRPIGAVHAAVAMSEEHGKPSGIDFDAGRVLVAGGGISLMQASTDLASAGYDVTIAFSGPLNAVTNDDAPGSCGFCDQLLPDALKTQSESYCFRQALGVYDTVELMVNVALSGVEASAEGLTATLVDDTGQERELLVDALIVDHQGPPEADIPGVFRCGDAELSKAGGLAATMAGASATAGRVSTWLASRGKRHATTAVAERAENGVPTHLVAVVQQALIVGGTAAGVKAAAALSARGVDVQLVERSDGLAGDDEEQQRLWKADNVTIHLDTELVEHSGTVGRFLAVARRADGEEVFLPHGAAIVAPEDNSPSERRGEIARLMGIELDGEGYYRAVSDWKPVDFARTGIFLADGNSPTAEENSQAAAQRVFNVLARQEMHAIKAHARVGVFCSSCQDCITLCPYEARSVNADGATVVDSAVCNGCGICVVNCDTGAAELVNVHDRETERLITSTIESTRDLLAELEGDKG